MPSDFLDMLGDGKGGRAERGRGPRGREPGPPAGEAAAGAPDAAGTQDIGPTLDELFLVKLRYKVGRLIEVGGNKPLLLDDRDAAWVVYAGKVDVFVVEVQEDGSTGPRTHLFRAETGHALFGVKPGEDHQHPQRLLAVGTAGTQLLKLQQSRLKPLAAQPAYAGEIARMLDHWAADLAGALAREMSPKEYVQLEAGRRASLAPGQYARPKDGVVWVRVLAGTLHLLGRETLALRPGPGLFPLDRHFWARAAEDAQVECVAAKDLVREEAGRFALDAFHGLILDFLALNMDQHRQNERERLAGRIARDERRMSGAVGHLAGVLNPELAPAWTTDGSGMDRLLAACRLVGEQQGIAVQAPPPASRAQAQRDPLGLIARASRVRLRRIALRGEWWQAEAGPLLAFTREGRRPVALLAARGGYVVRDPEQGTRVQVTPAVAATLADSAYAFYRPFPDKLLTLRDLVAFGVRGSRPDLLVVLLVGVMGGMLGTVTPIATAMIFDSIIPGAELGQLWQLGLALLVAAVSSALFQATRSLAMLRVEGRMDAMIQAAVWDRLLSLPVPFFQNYSAGDLAARAMGINAIRQTMSGMVVSSVLSIVFSLFSFGLLFYYDMQLALVATVLALGAAVAMGVAGYTQMRYQRALADLQGRISGMVVQFVAAISKLRVAGVEGHAFAFWAREFGKQKQLAYRARLVDNALNTFNSTYPIVTFIAIFATYSFLSSSELSTGEFLAFNSAFTQFLSATLSMSAAGLAIVGIVPLYERAKPIMRTMPEVDQAKTDPGELAGGIEVNHVSFRYGDKGPLVLEDISLQIEPGEFVALVGPSGSGKSTLFRLLLGFETAASGAIYYDGKDLARLDVRAVRRQTGVVLQNGKLSPGDIYTNIAGSSGLGLDAAWEAARMVGLDEDIRRMPMEMHTLIGEGGGTLSGGQKQRLLIARAIVTRPRIIYFDEATSALDNRTQAIVSESLERLEATRVVIAHRLSTIMHADKIFVIEKGRLVQSGTYQELINQRGPFAALAKRQLA